jgi:hypothetical protein
MSKEIINTSNLERSKNIPEKDRAILSRANLMTKIGYCTVDAAQTFFLDADSLLSRVGMGLKHEDKYLLKRALNNAKILKTQLAQLASVLYEIDENQFALEDSDYFYSLILLATDRIGSDSKVSERIIKYLNKLPSNLKIINNEIISKP